MKRIGMPEGPKFDAVIEQMFALQLNGRGKTPEEREKTLRKLSGIKEPAKQKEPKGKEKKGKGSEKAHAALMKMQGKPKGKAAEAKPAPKAAAKTAKPAAKAKKKK